MKKQTKHKKGFWNSVLHLLGVFRGAAILSVFYVIFGVYMWNEAFTFVEVPKMVLDYQSGFYFVSSVLLILASYIAYQYSVNKKI